MSVQEVLTLINSMGFPIAMCLILAYYVKYLTASNNDTLEQLRQTLEQNTLAITELTTKLELKEG